MNFKMTQTENQDLHKKNSVLIFFKKIFVLGYMIKSNK